MKQYHLSIGDHKVTNLFGGLEISNKQITGMAFVKPLNIGGFFLYNCVALE